MKKGKKVFTALMLMSTVFVTGCNKDSEINPNQSISEVVKSPSMARKGGEVKYEVIEDYAREMVKSVNESALGVTLDYNGFQDLLKEYGNAHPYPYSFTGEVKDDEELEIYQKISEIMGNQEFENGLKVADEIMTLEGEGMRIHDDIKRARILGTIYNIVVYLRMSEENPFVINGVQIPFWRPTFDQCMHRRMNSIMSNPISATLFVVNMPLSAITVMGECAWDAYMA